MERGREIASQGEIVLREDVRELADIADDEGGKGGSEAFSGSASGLGGVRIGAGRFLPIVAGVCVVMRIGGIGEAPQDRRHDDA